jgi:hypothetical protein
MLVGDFLFKVFAFAIGKYNGVKFFLPTFPGYGLPREKS